MATLETEKAETATTPGLQGAIGGQKAYKVTYIHGAGGGEGKTGAVISKLSSVRTPPTTWSCFSLQAPGGPFMRRYSDTRCCFISIYLGRQEQNALMRFSCEDGSALFS